jgi:hypothetical protein
VLFVDDCQTRSRNATSSWPLGAEQQIDIAERQPV